MQAENCPGIGECDRGSFLSRSGLPTDFSPEDFVNQRAAKCIRGPERASVVASKPNISHYQTQVPLISPSGRTAGAASIWARQSLNLSCTNRRVFDLVFLEEPGGTEHPVHIV
jgi:hypothetical protein